MILGVAVDRSHGQTGSRPAEGVVVTKCVRIAKEGESYCKSKRHENSNVEAREAVRICDRDTQDYSLGGTNPLETERMVSFRIPFFPFFRFDWSLPPRPSVLLEVFTGRSCRPHRRVIVRAKNVNIFGEGKIPS